LCQLKGNIIFNGRKAIVSRKFTYFYLAISLTIL